MKRAKEMKKGERQNPAPHSKPCFAFKPLSLTLSSWQEEERTGWNRVGLSQEFIKVGLTGTGNPVAGDRSELQKRSEKVVSLRVQAE